MQMNYKCDPELNITCTKENCFTIGGPCKFTGKLEFAKQPVDKVYMFVPKDDFDGVEFTEVDLDVE